MLDDPPVMALRGRDLEAGYDDGAMPIAVDAERRVARSRCNRLASRAVHQVRRTLGMNQTEFGRALARAGLPRTSQPAISGYERNERALPAAVLVATLELAQESGLDPAAFLLPELGPRQSEAEAEKLAKAFETAADLLEPDQATLLRTVAGSLRRPAS